MRKPAVLVTGASGEVGYGLIERLPESSELQIIALDLKELPPSLRQQCSAAIVGDILDPNLLQRLVTEFEIHAIYHLAALLSTRAEYTPETAHRVNVEGTLNLLKFAHEQARWHGHTVKFTFPSSIAVFGLPSLEAKQKAGKVRETDWQFPITMYGCNKAYCEHLGRYYSHHYRQLAAEAGPSGVDFRSVRFPGLISAVTMPSGGTSDYAVEMIHAAAQNKPYECFVPEHATLPFMVMPDAIEALLRLSHAPDQRITQGVYNIGAFSLSAAQLREKVLSAFPRAKITYVPEHSRAAIVDSWPADVDDSPARRDWDWKPNYTVDRAFTEYLFPEITRHYRSSPTS